MGCVVRFRYGSNIPDFSSGLISYDKIAKWHQYLNILLNLLLNGDGYRRKQ
jgi:hypothetical protein